MKQVIIRFTIILLLLSISLIVFSQEKPIVEWKIQIVESNDPFVTLKFSFVTEKGWTIYAINPDSSDINISAKFFFSSTNDSFSLIRNISSIDASSKFDEDLKQEVSYFLEKGTFEQKIMRKKSGVLKIEIHYTMFKETSTVIGFSGVLYKEKENFEVKL